MHATVVILPSINLIDMGATVHDFRVDYTTSNGNGGYIVVMAHNKTEARRKAKEQVILNIGETIRTMTIGTGQYYS